MGRTSKFSFPLPGRKHAATVKEKEIVVAKARSGNSNQRSKAQRFLGTDNDLNIDSPTRSDEHSWGYPSSRSSAMSISISESTHSVSSTNETGSISGTNADKWEYESGVLPEGPHLAGKPSSTLLGKVYGEDGGTDASSRRMRHEGSDSTLKSYYDRQKSPLSISQQTSASSARDLALRKGFPPVIQRSPLLQVDSIDQFDQQFSDSINQEELSRERSTKKKPARLDLSKLFSPRSRKFPTESPAKPPFVDSATSRNNGSGRRKLTKAPSKDSLHSQAQSHSSPRPMMQERQNSTATSNTLDYLYDSYANSPVRSPYMDRIPESRQRDNDDRWESSHMNQPVRAAPEIPSQRAVPKPRNDLSSRVDQYTQDSPYLSPPHVQPTSWKNMQTNIINPPWEVSSAASISSHNTKTSRHTSTSVFSNQDLKQSSVLSLSSDSEEEASDSEPMQPPPASHHDKASRLLNGSSHQSFSRHRQSQQVQAPAPVSRKHSSKKGAAHSSPFLTIPEGSLPNSRLSGPWSSPVEKYRSSSIKSQTKSIESREKRSSRKSTSGSSRLSVQYPPSPTSMDSRDSPRSSRYMAVTQQEEALLEALRQKRARMREKIIEEHEIAKSPPPIPNRTTSRYSEASSVSTIRADGSNGERILLYMRTPIHENQPLDTAEPSPDLSDFLTFGSDEDSTPRTSWAAPRNENLRPDSSVVRRDREMGGPMTPPSTGVRLSAVGTHSFRERSVSRKRTTAAVRFVEGKRGHSPNPQDFLLDENESEIWGM